MPQETVERRLAAILAADVAGYARLCEENDAKTLSALKERRAGILVPLVDEHHGRIVKEMGDGVLVEFASAVNAVACAAAIQSRMTDANEGVPDGRGIVWRIGVNLGDVIVDGGDLYGDGVNVAARLQTMAAPGEICVSGAVYDQVKRKIDLTFDELGLQRIKNIADPVPVFCIRQSAGTVAPREDLPLPAKPSIAVLPFTNMSGDPEQESFVDGLTEDLITDLSQSPGLFVIARNSTFAYKGRPSDVRVVAKDLGVRYVVEGSARRAAGRVRINAQLIDAVGGDHMWAERFDRSLEDIFAVQDEVTGKIVESLIGRLTGRPARRRPKNLEAYDLCVRARGLTLQTDVGTRESKMLLQRALQLEPDYAEAHSLMALNLWLGWEFWNEGEAAMRQAINEAERAVELDPYDAGNRWVKAILLGHAKRFEESEAEFEATFKLDPNHADAWAMRSDFMAFSGKPEEGLSCIQRALRLSPHPPGWYYWLMGQAYYVLGDYDAAIEALKHPDTYRTTSRRMLAAALAQAGRLDEARQEAELFLAANPYFTITHWINTQPIRDETLRARFADGYSKAGLPM
jgi:TolB-like protein